MENFKNIDEYIATFPKEIQVKLTSIREFIIANFPEVSEAISYAMPTFRLNGNLVHFAGYKNHIGFYPGSSGVANFLDKLTEYKTSKGAIQFPIEASIPFNLIKEIIEFRIKENLSKLNKTNKSNKSNKII